MPTKKAVAEVVESLDVVDEVVDKAIEGVDVVDQATHSAAVASKRGLRGLKSPKTVVFGVAGLGLLAGAGLGVAGYFLMKKRLEKQYEERLNQEIEEMRTFYKRRFKKSQYATPADAAKELLTDAEQAAEKARTEYTGDKTAEGPVQYNKHAAVSNGDASVTVEATEVVTERNIFVDNKPMNVMEWDSEVEESKRNPESPYVISFEEFNENTFEHPQNTITYYEGDDVLADDREQVIEDVEATVGNDNLMRFGHGSKDNNVVYIRNERLEMDFEVIRSTGKYAEEVLGFKHSEEPRRRRPRWGDDE